MQHKLYLIPTTIGETEIGKVIPQYVMDIVKNMKVFIVENERTARRQLIKMGIGTPIDELTFFVLNKHTDRSSIVSFLKPIETGDIGLLSEAGVPCVADPGSDIVFLAQEKNIPVEPLVGPSSILMALMASGMNGQCFTFHGYLPVKPNERVKKLKEIELLSMKNNQTQIFIEAPYRNNQMLEDIIKTCGANTLVCVACNISQDDEYIKTRRNKDWKKNKPDFHKKPSLFLIYHSK